MENYLPKTMDFYLPKSMDFSLPFTLGRDETVSLGILSRICDVLDCDFGDIVEHIKENENI